jgi:predicted nucleotidyltransferase
VIAAVGRALAPVEGVRVAYLFGSWVTGRARPDSDLDLAVALDPALSEEERLQTTLAVIAATTDELGALGERVDVVDLRDADPAVAFKAIQGTCVVSRDERERVRLEVYVARRFDDDAPRRELVRSAARARWGAM